MKTQKRSCWLFPWIPSEQGNIASGAHDFDRLCRLGFSRISARSPGRKSLELPLWQIGTSHFLGCLSLHLGFVSLSSLISCHLWRSHRSQSPSESSLGPRQRSCQWLIFFQIFRVFHIIGSNWSTGGKHTFWCRQNCLLSVGWWSQTLVWLSAPGSILCSSIALRGLHRRPSCQRWMHYPSIYALISPK